jgi:indole-3-glycerol phosphate synthase
MNVLDDIIAHKKREVEARKRIKPLKELMKTEGPQRRDFKTALMKSGLSVIAEIKGRSPSGGTFFEKTDPERIAKEYHDLGASALSILTDEKYFGGNGDWITKAKPATPLPVLRKEFIVDEYQIAESRALGADAVLLIVRILGRDELRRFIRLADELGLAALVEVHDESEINPALDAGARILGVNNRNLDTLETTVQQCLDLIHRIPKDRLKIAESGIKSLDDVSRITQAGYDGILVGESLLRGSDIRNNWVNLFGEPNGPV